MKQVVLPLWFALLTTVTYAQRGLPEIDFWTGSGSDTAFFVVDFNDNSDFESYVWGVLFTGTATGNDLIQAVGAADPAFQFVVNNGFLNDITYQQQAGLGGQPDWWSTWSGNDMGGLASNLGLGTAVLPGEIFACSYTDFNPATYPDTPVAARNPMGFTFADVTFWVGSGSDSSVLVIDFRDTAGPSSFAWGILHSGNVTGADLLDSVLTYDNRVTANVSSGFLSDLIFDKWQGLGGQPDWWGTWSATNMADWTSNLGLATPAMAGEFFGCSYMDFSPAIPPATPVAVSVPTSIQAASLPGQLYPNPASGWISFGDEPVEQGNITAINGQLVHTFGTTRTVTLPALATGSYLVEWVQAGQAYHQQLFIR